MRDVEGVAVNMYYRIARAIITIVVLVASLPLSILAMQRGFGIAASLTVPTCCLGYWLSIASPDRARRIGWFVFSSVCVALLPTCPWWQQQIEAVLNWVQHFLRDPPKSAVLYSGVETVAFFMLAVLPWGVGCVLGWLAARLARKLLYASINKEESKRQSAYGFTLRGMLLSIAVYSVLAAWLSSTVRQWHTRELTNQKTFLQRFTGSFASGNVKLLDEPEIAEDHAIIKWSQKSSGISEYRVIAPIEENGLELWAVWNFLCDEAYPGTVSKFGYAEATMQSGLPAHPFPLTEYLREPNYTMIDGKPKLRTRATIINAPIVAKAGETISIVAETDRYMMCDLVIRPFQAVTLPPSTITAPETGIVRWEVKLNPTYSGSQIECEFQARTNMAYRAKTVSRVIAVEKDIPGE